MVGGRYKGVNQKPPARGIQGYNWVMSDQGEHRPRRWLQFRLRWLFVLCTLCAAWLGWQAQQALDQRRALRMVVRVRGTYEFEDAPPSTAQAIVSKLFGRMGTHEVAAIYLQGTTVTDAELGLLAGLKSPRRLSLVSTAVGDASLTALARLHSLECLDLRFTQISTEAVEALRHALPDTRIYRWNDTD